MPINVLISFSLREKVAPKASVEGLMVAAIGSMASDAIPTIPNNF